MKIVLACLCLVLGIGPLCAQYEPPAQEKWSSQSPDGMYEAITRINPNTNGRADMATGRLLVVKHNASGNKDTYIRYDIPRLISHIKWSPDSKFLVMTTVSAGGHSPWHFNAYVYTVADESLRYMDGAIGSVVAADFKFVGPHVVAMKIGDFENPKVKEVDLNQQLRSMPQENGKEEGSLKK